MLLTALVLLLFVSSCTVRPEALTGEQESIQDTDWVLLSFGDQNIPAPQNTRTSYIHFDMDNQSIRGFAGCNSFRGKYDIRRDKITISELNSTRMSCPDMEVENYLLGILDEITSFNLSDKFLTLYKGNQAVVTFQAATGEPLSPEIDSGQQE